MKNEGIKVVLVMICLCLSEVTSAQKKEFANSNKFTLAAGLSQPLALKGYNIAGAYFTKRLTFEWSHGWSLNPPLSDEQKADNLEFEITWTTGPGIGYRITQALDVRAEFKAHHYEVSFKSANAQTSYTTFTIGPGFYYRIYPFKKGALRGLLIEPNVRYWPLVGSTLTDNQYAYSEGGTSKVHDVITNPFIFNCNIAWTFGR
jgi:hypothetical protein